MNYVAPVWLPGGHLQTIWAALYGRRGPGTPPVYRRERWDTADGDFVDLDFAVAPASAGASAAPAVEDRPLLVLFHGLEGSSRSHYAEAFAATAAARGWDYVVPHFRGCGGTLNLAPRAYHSGDFGEIGWILERLRAGRRRPLLAVGISLGGNALLRWLGESRPDIVSLQELKAPDERFPAAAIAAAGYEAIWHGQKSWNGVAILSRCGTPVETRRGLPGDPDPAQSRYIEAAVNGVIVAGLYLPNGNPRPGAKFDYKLT